MRSSSSTSGTNRLGVQLFFRYATGMIRGETALPAVWHSARVSRESAPRGPAPGTWVQAKPTPRTGSRNVYPGEGRAAARYPARVFRQARPDARHPARASRERPPPTRHPARVSRLIHPGPAPRTCVQAQPARGRGTWHVCSGKARPVPRHPARVSRESSPRGSGPGACV